MHVLFYYLYFSTAVYQNHLLKTITVIPFLLESEIWAGFRGGRPVSTHRASTAGTAQGLEGDPCTRQLLLLAGKVVQAVPFFHRCLFMGWLGSKERLFQKTKTESGQFLSLDLNIILCHFFHILFARNSSRSQIQGQKSYILPFNGRCAKIFEEHVTKPPHLIRFPVQQWFHYLWNSYFMNALTPMTSQKNTSKW